MHKIKKGENNTKTFNMEKPTEPSPEKSSTNNN